jgi:hypothetical protein
MNTIFGLAAAALWAQCSVRRARMSARAFMEDDLLKDDALLPAAKPPLQDKQAV